LDIYYFIVARKHVMCGKLEYMKHLRLTNFFAIPLEKKDSEIAEMTEITQKEDVNTGLRYVQRVKRLKFEEEQCKEMKWVSFNHSTRVVRCANCALFSELADCNSKFVNGISAPFKLETFKKRE
jgi:curli biogenesis system outer membrane secretion channel CsgG